MPESWYNDAGTWRKAREIWYNDNGTWRLSKELWINDAGTWRKVFSPGFSAFYMSPWSLTGLANTEPGFEEPGAAYLRWDPTGQLSYDKTIDGGYDNVVNVVGEWAAPLDVSGLSGANHEILVTLLSTTGFGYISYTNVNLGAWTSMGSYNKVEVVGSPSSSISKFVSFNCKVRKVGTTVNLIDTNFSLKGNSVNAP